MKCKICNKNIFYNLRFKDLFEFNFVCSKCRELINPKLSIIPLDYGYYIKYYYFILDDEYLDEIEYKIYPKIFEIFKKEKDSIILLLEESELYILKFLNFRQNIVLIKEVYSYLEDIIM